LWERQALSGVNECKRLISPIGPESAYNLTFAMKVTGKPIPTSVGIFFIAFALLEAALVLPGAKGAQSPILYVCIIGGLFIGTPAALGIGVVLENRRKRN